MEKYFQFHLLVCVKPLLYSCSSEFVHYHTAVWKARHVYAGDLFTEAYRYFQITAGLILVSCSQRVQAPYCMIVALCLYTLGIWVGFYSCCNLGIGK